MRDTAGLSPRPPRVARERHFISRAFVALSFLFPLVLIALVGNNNRQTSPVVTVSEFSSHLPSAQTPTAYPSNVYHSPLVLLDAPALLGFGQPSRESVNASYTLHDGFDAPRPPRMRVPAADRAADGASLGGLAPVAWTRTRDNARVPGYYQTSEFMLGRVAVGIVFPQCNGVVDQCTEVWTPSAMDQVATQIKAGTDWWVEQMHGRVSFALYPERNIPTNYEPIQHSQRDEKVWIGDIMTHLGFSGSDYAEQVYAYNNWLRQEHGTDWAFTIFVANSQASTTGAFSNGYFSYSYVPGPFTVETYDNGRYGIANMAAVIAHETGHIFGALDEYANAKIACTAMSGYLTLQNQNSQQNCASNTESIMRGGLVPYIFRLIDPYALGMVGQRVSGTGDLPDPINTTPALVLQPVPATITSTDVTIIGKAEDIPYGPPTDHAISINYITGVQYRIDGDPWQPALLSDGSAAFHKVSQGFTLKLSLSPGCHVLEVQATNRVGHVSPIVTATLIVDRPQ